jgi:proline dehydrogenase
MMANPKPDFQNTEIAFKHLSDRDLYRAWSLFRTINFKPLVVAGPPILSAALKLRLPVKSLVRATVFKQFCGGETLDECQETVEQLSKGGVYSILDYGVEGEKTEAGFDAAMREVLNTVRAAKGQPRIPFCVFKLTALARFELLEKVSEIGVNSMTGDLANEWQRVEARVSKICDEAIRAGKQVMIDAEETWIQPAIDHLAFAMMRKHNRASGVVFTTIQMYCKQGLSNVQKLLALGAAEGFIPAIKLVRGAYMEKERARAAARGYESPIHPDKAATDKAYDDALAVILGNNSPAFLCAGTHNANSCQRTIALMEKGNMSPDHARVWFAQLLGMSDDLSFNLASAGYHAAKYLPYGPIAAVLPYLFRRAEENTSIAGQSGRELQLIERELRRRSQCGRS